MDEILFNEDPPIVRTAAPSTKQEPLFNRIVVSMGLAKTTAEADTVLVVVAIAGLVISAIVTTLAFFPPHAAVSKAVLDADLAHIQAEQLRAQGK